MSGGMLHLWFTLTDLKWFLAVRSSDLDYFKLGHAQTFPHDNGIHCLPLQT